LHFDDPASDPIAVLEHDDVRLHREGKSYEKESKETEMDKDCEPLMVHHLRSRIVCDQKFNETGCMRLPA
jgi:hypothetical protein